MDRPSITSYTDLIKYVADMLAYRKAADPNFSVLAATKTLRRMSPALVSLMVQGKRKITWDRTDELSKLLNLKPSERQYLRDWVLRTESGDNSNDIKKLGAPPIGSRRHASSHILTDWVNIFVKDAFDLEYIRQSPEEIYPLLGGIASKQRIDRSIKFLMQHGYLRRSLNGQIVPESRLHSVDQNIPDNKIQQFHKALLQNAKEAIDQYSPEKRYANALVLSLNEETYRKLLEIIAEHAESLQSFAETLREGSMLYQVTINVSPTGGQRHDKK